MKEFVNLQLMFCKNWNNLLAYNSHNNIVCAILCLIKGSHLGESNDSKCALNIRLCQIPVQSRTLNKPNGVSQCGISHVCFFGKFAIINCKPLGKDKLYISLKSPGVFLGIRQVKRKKTAIPSAANSFSSFMSTNVGFCKAEKKIIWYRELSTTLKM